VNWDDLAAAGLFIAGIVVGGAGALYATRIILDFMRRKGRSD
jgi:hypothetical protein